MPRSTGQRCRMDAGWPLTKSIDYGEGSAEKPGFPEMPSWFGVLDFKNPSAGLRNTGMDAALISKVMGGNWFKFLRKSFEPKI